MKTIAQISTPLGSGGISIVRLSGDKSLDIAFSFFCAKNLTKNNIEPRKLYLGEFRAKTFKERCLMVYFKSPFSFTGEDIVEFQCHGGELLTTKILETLISGGASIAENGEFSKRAFINGKMTLDEAEGMIDMINATSEAELKTASSLAGGAIYKKVSKMQEDIKNALVDIEVSIDYPEHDDDVMAIKDIKILLLKIKNEINKMLETINDGQIIRFGVSVSIVGKPNVGKSSLLNALIGDERAIVTNIKGTTRDILKETITYKGIKINFLDTAGVRESEDEVEKIGIQRSLKAISDADIVIGVIDASQPLDNEDKQVLEKIKNKKHFVVLNKCDLPVVVDINNSIKISALNNENITEIKNKILKMVSAEKIDFSEYIITNQRHAQVLKETKDLLEEAICACDNQTADIVDLVVKDVWKTLGKISGETEQENIIDKIFNKFCLGK